jgi:hypothetical protein
MKTTKNMMLRIGRVLFSTLVAAVLVTLTSCEDGPDQMPPTTPTVKTVELPESPTTDQVANAVDSPVIFLGNESSKEFSALQNRLKNISASLSDKNLHNIVIAANEINNINAENTEHLRATILRGGNIVVTNPEISTIEKLVSLLGKTVDIPVYRSNDKPISVIGVKQGKTYYAFKGGGANKTNAVYVHENLQSDEVKEIPVNYVEKEASDYVLGIKMDGLAKWLQQPANPLKLMKTLNDDEEQALQDLMSAQEITIDMGIELDALSSSGSWWSTYHNIEQVYRIWKAHSFDNNGKDFYCIKEEITAYNQNLQCGPEHEDEWTNISRQWELWRLAMQSVDEDPDWTDYSVIYGPYMRKINITNNLTVDSQQPLKVEAYDPENNSSGGATVTENFSYSLGGNMGCGMSGPSIGGSLGLSWGTSVSKFDADLSATANMTTDGELNWTYVGARPQTHFEVFSTNEHDLARSILKNTCTLHQAWIWSVPSSGSGKVHLNGEFEVYDEWLTYYLTPYETHEVYFGPSGVSRGTYDITVPPQYQQQWAMTVEPVSAALEDFLSSHLGNDYYWTNAVFFCEKETHTPDDTDDEISAYVKASKDMFDSNPELMKQAAEAAGIDSYTIKWNNLQGPEDSNFVYEVK